MICVKFKASVGSALYKAEGTGKNVCEIVMGSELAVSLWYDFSADPLRLTAAAIPGDDISLLIFPYRIELRVNGRLADEEWPCGALDLLPGSLPEGDFAPVISRENDADPESGEIYTRRSVAADDIRLPGVNIGDCMPYSDTCDGRYHLFYLYDRHHHSSKWGLGAHQWAHVSTEDFRVWDEHPMAVGISDDFEGSICTGSVCRAVGEDGKSAWYAWYAVRMSDRSPARMTYAFSDDLVHFKKCGRYFSLPEGYEPTSARDPMVFYLDGKYHMLVTTSRLSDNSGCLAHLTNDKMAIDGWTDAGVVLAWADLADKDDPTRYWQPECPDFFRAGKYYYLVFGIGGTSRYGYSERPFEGYVFPENNCIPAGSVPKSALFQKTGKRIFAGFIGEGGYAGRLCAAEASPLPDGRLSFREIEI